MSHLRNVRIDSETMLASPFLSSLLPSEQSSVSSYSAERSVLRNPEVLSIACSCDTMPKTKPSLDALLESYGPAVFSNVDGTAFCELCSSTFSNPRKYTLDQHVGTVKHTESRRLREASSALAVRERAVNQTVSRRNYFSTSLTEAFVKADIPLEKLQNECMKKFLEEISGQHVPAPTTLRAGYIQPLYDSALESVREAIGDSPIWVSIDESTDSCGRYVAHVLVSKLSPENASRSFLLTCENLSETNSTTISQLFIRAMTLLWRGECYHDRVLLFVSDAAPYMKKVYKTLSGIFPKLYHVTCLAHGIHRIAEEVRGVFDDVDALISNVKKIFVKSPTRVVSFRNAFNIPLPPAPILTRWGTWIEAALYYEEHLTDVRNFVCNSLDPDEAKCIRVAQWILRKRTLESDLRLIRIAFLTLPQVITSLESYGMPLVEAIGIVEKFEGEIRALRNARLGPVKTRAVKVFENNIGFQELKHISHMLQGDIRAEESLGNRSVNDIMMLKFAPIVSTDVERSFSRYKAFLRDNRRGFEFENLSKYVVVLCNQ